jgi:hypothetical protein
MITIAMKYWIIPIADRIIRAQSMHVPADLIVVCLWSAAGLVGTALLAACVGSVDVASILAATE